MPLTQTGAAILGIVLWGMIHIHITTLFAPLLGKPIAYAIVPIVSSYGLYRFIKFYQRQMSLRHQTRNTCWFRLRTHQPKTFNAVKEEVQMKKENEMNKNAGIRLIVSGTIFTVGGLALKAPPSFYIGVWGILAAIYTLGKLLCSSWVKDLLSQLGINK